MGINCLLGNHDWTQDCGRCAQCGKTRVDAHRSEKCRCTKCGAHLPHRWVNETCSECGVSLVEVVMSAQNRAGERARERSFALLRENYGVGGIGEPRTSIERKTDAFFREELQKELDPIAKQFGVPIEAIMRAYETPEIH